MKIPCPGPKCKGGLLDTEHPISVKYKGSAVTKRIYRCSKCGHTFSEAVATPVIERPNVFGIRRFRNGSGESGVHAALLK